MLVTDMRPISMVEGEGFKALIKTLHPGYVLPSRWVNCFNACYVVFEICFECKTADAWTSVATKAYLGITCHYIGDNWEMESVCLTTLPLQDRHTASNIADWLEEVVAKYEIPVTRVAAIVHDNGANIVGAARLLEEKHGWMSVRRTGHTLQLAVNTAIKAHQSTERALGAARSLVEHFHKSELARTKLKAKQLQMNTPQKKLIQDVATRWNSTYYMVESLLQQRWPVTATLLDSSITPKGKRYLDLKPDQWSLLEELLKTLKRFEVATVFMSGQNYVTISAVPTLARGLLKATQNASFESPPMKAFQATMTEQLKKRWDRETSFTDTAPNAVIMSAALDPRFKKL
ncbi:PREDICTED: zinc finger BED domain-containing protein 1-like, partial [Xyrichtys novacula]